MNGALFFLFFLTLALIALIAVAAYSGGGSAQPLRVARRLLGLYAVLTLLVVLGSSGNWVHLLWSVVFPTWGMFTGAGLLLLQTWPRDRAARPAVLRGWNGALIALVWLLALGILPPLLAHALLDPFPTGRVSGSTLPALVDVARYGFDGPIPSLMTPVTADQVARGLGSPPRFVTVALGTSMTSAAAIIGFVALALLGRLMSTSVLRGAFWLLAPVAIAVATFPGHGGFEEALWRNEPWIIQAYGPTIVTAIAAAAVLVVAVGVDELRSRRVGVSALVDPALSAGDARNPSPSP